MVLNIRFASEWSERIGRLVLNKAMNHQYDFAEVSGTEMSLLRCYCQPR